MTKLLEISKEEAADIDKHGQPLMDWLQAQGLEPDQAVVLLCVALGNFVGWNASLPSDVDDRVEEIVELITDCSRTQFLQTHGNGRKQ